MSWFVSLTDKLSVEEEVKEVTEEEHKMDVACSWMEVGGFLALAEEGAQGLLWQLFLFTWYCLPFLTILSLLYG